MNKFRIKFRRSEFGNNKKIADIRDFRAMTRNPFTNECCTLTSARHIVEAILGSGASLTMVDVTPDEAATILANWMHPDFWPDGWRLVSVEPIKVEPAPVPFTLDYYA